MNRETTFDKGGEHFLIQVWIGAAFVEKFGVEKTIIKDGQDAGRNLMAACKAAGLTEIDIAIVAGKLSVELPDDAAIPALKFEPSTPTNRSFAHVLVG